MNISNDNDEGNAFIDLYNNVIKFNDKNVFIIVDDDDLVWFKAIDVAIMLEYKRTTNAIQYHVDDDDKRTFGDLKSYVRYIPPNSQLSTIYINEAGFYSIVFSSQMPIAKAFKSW